MANKYDSMTDDELTRILRNQFGEKPYFGTVRDTSPALAHALDRHGLSKSLCSIALKRKTLLQMPQEKIIEHVKASYSRCCPSVIRSTEFGLWRYLNEMRRNDGDDRTLIQYLLDEGILLRGEKVHHNMKPHAPRWAHLNGGVKSRTGKYADYFSPRGIY